MGRLNKRLNKKAEKPIASTSSATNNAIMKQRKKKDLMLARKTEFRKRLAAIDHMNNDLKKKKKGQKVSFEDFKDFQVSIDKVIEEDEKEKAKRPGKKMSKSTLKEEKRKKEFLKQCKIFGQISRHPEFVKSPLETISTHLENKVKAGLL